MAFNYVRMRATALRLITRFGGAGVLVWFTDEGLNDATSAVESPVRNTENIQTVILPIDERYRDQLISGQTAFGYIAGSDTVPVVGNHIVFNVVEYEILNVNKISPSGYDVLYQVALSASSDPTTVIP